MISFKIFEQWENLKKKRGKRGKYFRMKYEREKRGEGGINNEKMKGKKGGEMGRRST